MFACIEAIPDVKFFFLAKVNKAEYYIAFGKVNVDLSYMQDYLDLQEIFRQHYDLLPYSMMTSFPWDWRNPSEMQGEIGQDYWSEDEDLPF